MSVAPFLPVADGLCWAIVHSIWQGTAVAVVFWIVQRLGLFGPKGRHDLGCFLLAVLPLAAMVSFNRALTAAARMPEFPGNLSGISLLASVSSQPVSDPTLGSLTWSWPAWAKLSIALSWIVGSTALLLRSAMGLWAIRQVAGQSALPLPEDLSEVARVLIRDLGLPASTKVMSCAGSVVPYTYGWIAPVVVMPLAAIAGLDTMHLQLLLRHELAHVLRRDFAFNALQNAAESLFFYHPLVWWLSGQIREDREAACDQVVMGQGVNRIGYARALAALEALRHDAPEASVGARGGNLKMRIQYILRENSIGSRSGWTGLAIAVAIGLAGILAACTVDSWATDSSRRGAAIQSAPNTLNIAWLPPNVARYRGDLERAAQAHRVDPNLLAIMVLVESGGNARARSPYGALGLLQLMPSTARVVAEHAGIAPPSDEALFDVSLNLELGARFLADLLVSFDHADEKTRLHNVLSAYNAGSEATRTHLDTGKSLPEETVRYVALLEALYREKAEASSPAYERHCEAISKFAR